MKVGTFFCTSSPGIGLSFVLNDDELGFLWPKAPARDRRVVAEYVGGDLLFKPQADSDNTARTERKPGYSLKLRHEMSASGPMMMFSMTLGAYGVPESDWPGRVRRTDVVTTRKRDGGTPYLVVAMSSIRALSRVYEARTHHREPRVRDNEPLFDDEWAAEPAPVRHVDPTPEQQREAAVIRSPARPREPVKPAHMSWTVETRELVGRLNDMAAMHEELHLSLDGGRLVARVITEVEL